jgi:hypothetical protein
VFAEEQSAEFGFGDPLVDGDRAAVEWWATVQLRGGGEERLRGVTVLRFAADGRCLRAPRPLGRGLASRRIGL